MRTFILVWLGQTMSLVGSQMTHFALTIWIWQRTGEATSISLLAFFIQVPILVASIFVGILVDRFNRKMLMMVGDAIAGFSTILILILLLTQHLDIWHLYLTGSISGLFGYVQALAFSASQSLLISQQHYVRIGALGSISTFGSSVLAPSLAGVAYPLIGLSGILVIDVMTFVVAIGLLAIASIPQPQLYKIQGQLPEISPGINISQIWQELSFGFRYLLQNPGLGALQLFAMGYIFFDNAALLEPIILARADSNAVILGHVFAALGLGGLIGAIGLGIWGGPEHRIRGVLWGRAVIFSLEMLIGLGRTPVAWITAFFCAGLLKPTANSCEEAIWLAAVPPEMQGRVFSANSFLIGILSSFGLLISGPLSDQVFEPAMRPGGILAPAFGPIFGTEIGSGMALQFTLFSFVVVLICLGCYAVPVLRRVEEMP
ncbi:MAG: MFS transporter [Leptolyngbyaceae bacterium]|nr:MFS transporter [Leptolyngbyaceae bacterium]